MGILVLHCMYIESFESKLKQYTFLEAPQISHCAVF
jgi:hypothetical protein